MAWSREYWCCCYPRSENHFALWQSTFSSEKWMLHYDFFVLVKHSNPLTHKISISVGTSGTAIYSVVEHVIFSHFQCNILSKPTITLAAETFKPLKFVIILCLTYFYDVIFYIDAIDEIRERSISHYTKHNLASASII